MKHFTVLFSSTFYKLQRLKMFYLEHKHAPILEDYINDTLKDDRNRSWRVILFVFKTLPEED